MYYATAKKDVSFTNFCNLVDAAVVLYDKEHNRLQDKGKSIDAVSYEEEAKIDKSFFNFFPRKTRTSVMRFSSERNPQNLNGASTSSSLLDLNSIPVDYEVEDPRTPFNWLPSSSSSSSSFDNTWKMTKSSPNPYSKSSPSSCLTNNKRSRKRHAVQQIERSGEFKKPKVASVFSWKEREVPEWLVQLMRDMNGSDLKLIFERKLFKTDVNSGESRLSMPFNHLIRNDFLTPVEWRIIEDDINNDKKIGVGAILVDQQAEKWGVILKRWEMKKQSGKGSWNYSLTCGWNDVVTANRLKEGDDISIWSFRWRELLCFALVRPPPTTTIGHSSSSLAPLSL